MKASLLLIAMLVSISAADAEDVMKLRAGEHSDFSRIVIPELNQQWSISTTGRTVEVTFANGTPEFDLSDLTDKHKAHRVLSAKISARGEERVLALTLACDCSVNTTQNYRKSIIIDIFDAEPAASASNEKLASATTSADDTMQLSVTSENGVVTAKPVENTAQASVSPATQIVVREVADKITDSDDVGDAQKPSEESLLAARDRMIALLAEARARGVVQIKNDSGGDEIANALSRNVNDKAGENTANATPGNEAAESVTCIDPTRFSDRPQEPRDYATILALREEMDNAVGEKRLAAGQELAGAYLRIGFFEEASAVAQTTTGGKDDELMLAAALAELSGAANANGAKTLSHYAKCGPAYEMLYAAAKAQHGAEYAAGLSDTQINALNALMRSLRGPIAEIFALNSIDHDETASLRRYYEIASRARAPELTPALAIIEAALPDALSEPGVFDEPLIEIAQTPGPLQTRALGELAAQYENDAKIAYEGFLEDLAAQKSKISGKHGDARASIAGAKALASAGRIVESIDLLANVAKSSTAARGVARAVTQSILMDALAGENDISRLLAVDAFLEHRDFIASTEGRDDELVLSIAREVADIGAPELTDKIIAASSHKRTRRETNVVRALAQLNAGADQAALALIEKHNGSAEAAAIAARAAERLEIKPAVISAVRRALRGNYINEETAAAAWRTGEWKLAADAYTKLASENAEDGSRLALSALMSGAKSIPTIASNALASDPAALETAQHMFAPAPHFSPSNLEDAAAYAAGVAAETAHIRERLNDE